MAVRDAPGSTLPGFLGIGAQKAGTSWLYRNLQRHEQIWLPPKKELHYFDQLDRPGSTIAQRLSNPRFRRVLRRRLAANIRHPSLEQLLWDIRYFSGRRDDAWYASLFAHSHGKIAGDITPAYSTLDESTVRRVHDLLPDAKLILILRNPIDRAWSHALMDLASRTGRPASSIPMAEFIAHFDGPESRLRGDYARTLQNWRRHFPAPQMLVSAFEDIHSRPNELLRQICEFLAISAPPDSDTARSSVAVNRGQRTTIPPVLKSYLARVYAPKLADLEALVEGSTLTRVRHWREGAARHGDEGPARGPSA